MTTKQDWNQWANEKKKDIENNTDFLLLRKDELKTSKLKVIIFVICWFVSILFVMGVFYSLVSNEYFKGEMFCGDNFINNTCESVQVQCPKIDLPNIPACPVCPIPNVNVYVNSTWLNVD